MKKLATLLVASAFLVLAASAAMASNQLRISQVYGGGGSSSSTATYNVDYVEIFNSGGTAVNIGGWTIEYGSSAGLWGSSATNIFTFPTNTTIQPCKYILVAYSSASSGGGNLPVTPDYTFSLTISATAGKVALFNTSNSNVACGSETGLQDKVAFGSNNCAEGTGTAALSVTTGDVRNGAGNTDTDSNVSDFTVTSGPVPRNSSTPANADCLATPTSRGTWGQLKSIYR